MFFIGTMLTATGVEDTDWLRLYQPAGTLALVLGMMSSNEHLRATSRTSLRAQSVDPCTNMDKNTLTNSCKNFQFSSNNRTHLVLELQLEHNYTCMY